jgi:hypothetical protein
MEIPPALSLPHWAKHTRLVGLHKRSAVTDTRPGGSMAQLSEKSVADGRSFLQALDGAGVVSSAALWLWRSSENAWRYVLSSPLVQKGSDMPVKIAAVLATMPADFAVNRDNILLYESQDPASRPCTKRSRPAPASPPCA